MTLYALGDLVPKTPDDGDFFVAPDANVIGDIRILTGASIWFGSTLRGDNEQIVVGQGSNIQENCVLHTDMGYPLTIGTNCTIGHKAMLHGCTIEDGALVGMGATVLNGAVIGKGALVGAGALIAEGKVIPPGALVMGAPGRVVRQLDEAAIQSLQMTAIHYQERMRQFRRDMKVVG